MTDRLTYDQRYNAVTAIAAHRTERATTGDMEAFYYENMAELERVGIRVEAFYYENMVDAVDELGDNDLMAELERVGIRVEDL